MLISERFYFHPSNVVHYPLSMLQIFPGETALAFFTASNPTDQPITGVSTYNVIPFEAGQYFNKIQVYTVCIPYYIYWPFVKAIYNYYYPICNR